MPIRLVAYGAPAGLPLLLKYRYNGFNDDESLYGMNLVLQLLSLIFVVLWTARLARNKGRNILAWSAIAAVPAVGLLNGFPDWITVLCMFPMLALVFVPARPTTNSTGIEDDSLACPRCQHSHDAGTTFCTNCGWELVRPYATADAPAEGNSAGEDVQSPLEPTPSSAAASAAPEPVIASSQSDTAPEGSTVPGVTAAADLRPDPIPFSAQPLKVTQPLTAAGMTERGLALINQGRAREAVDQFTKAIALDPRYREAWANRAKAYSELGLIDKAAADTRQLEAI
jgi:tetratricopeptide (TPR) repeat protein